jgi:hypothetical protein
MVMKYFPEGPMEIPEEPAIETKPITPWDGVEALTDITAELEPIEAIPTSPYESRARLDQARLKLGNAGRVVVSLSNKQNS